MLVVGGDTLGSMSRPRLVPMLVTLAAACSPAPTDPVPVRSAPAARVETALSDPAVKFSEMAQNIQRGYLEASPGEAVSLGLHAFDGKLPDVSAGGLAREVERLAGARSDLEAVRGLSPELELQRQVLLVAVRGAQFDRVDWRQPQRNPMFYIGALALAPYISREYAPLAKRARGVIGVASATPHFLRDAAANLSESIPRTWLSTALLQVDGIVTFVQKDVTAAFRELDDQTLAAELNEAVGGMVAALQTFRGELEAREPHATDDFPLGEAAFLKMLSQAQGVDIELAALRATVEQDLARNEAALAEAASKIAPGRSVDEVVLDVASRKPEDTMVEAAAQAAEMRRFLVDRDIVSIPGEDVALVVPTPPFLRYNFAFLDAAGVFERKSLPSFYYISPPDPSWSPAKQRGYVPCRSDLLFVTIHEVWPGHFLHSLHLKRNDSQIVKSHWNYVMGEGWAHYTEQMMWDEGVSDDERDHVGQLMNALLRNVRSLSAIGMHTAGMTVEESKRLFVERAFQDDATAEQQAIRGTFDPMYLAYNIGKLMILKLRKDWMEQRRAASEPATLRVFHDTFLGYGAAPIPVIREMMLGPDAGPVL